MMKSNKVAVLAIAISTLLPIQLTNADEISSRDEAASVSLSKPKMSIEVLHPKYSTNRVYSIKGTELYEDIGLTKKARSIDPDHKLIITNQFDKSIQVTYASCVYYTKYESVTTIESNRRRHDIDLLARIIAGEAINQPEEGQRAVGSVVMNRVHNPQAYGHSSSIEGVITYPNQFSGYQANNWYNPNSTNYRIAEEVYEGRTNLPIDVTNFKANYDTSDWNLQFYASIGDHDFYYRY